MARGSVWCVLIFASGFLPFYSSFLTTESPSRSTCRSLLFICKNNRSFPVCAIISSLCSRMGVSTSFSWRFKWFWIQDRLAKLFPFIFSSAGFFHLELAFWSVLVVTWIFQPLIAVLLNDLQIRFVHRVLFLELGLLFWLSFQFAVPCSHHQLGTGFFTMSILAMMAGGNLM